MKTKHFIGIAGGIILVAILMLTSALFSKAPEISVGSAVDGVNAVAFTTASSSVGIYTASTLFASSTTCTSRVISTNQGAINLSFDPNFTPTATAGYAQPASTTVAYDSGIYGCGITKAYAIIATSTVTYGEFR